MVGYSISSRTCSRRFYRGSVTQSSLCARSIKALTTYTIFVSLVFIGVVSLSLPSRSEAAPRSDVPIRHIQTVIPILGTTTDENAEPVGIVAEIQLEFLERRDHDGLDVQFQSAPGKFSPYAQQSVIEALHLVVKAAALNPDSWTVRFQLPYPGVTLYGESL